MLKNLAYMAKRHMETGRGYEEVVKLSLTRLVLISPQ